VAVHQLLPGLRWEHVPFHAAVEAIGSFAALSLAALILMLLREKTGAAYRVWIACGLVSMGVLDGCHACQPPGAAVVWLRSLATVAGGALFVLVWLPERLTPVRMANSLAFTMALVAAALGAFVSASPHALPLAVHQHGFSFETRAVNLAGGALFVLAAGRFLTRYRSGGHWDEPVFAALCLLFGTAGLLFPLSKIWMMDWWFWHFVRLGAYLVALGYVFLVFRSLTLTLEQRDRERAQSEERLRAALQERTQSEERLRAVLRELSEAVSVLESATTEILASTTQTVASATQTATSVSETSTTVEEVRHTAQLASQKARHVAESAGNAAQISQAGRKATEDTREEMQHIRNQMESIAESMTHLSEQGQAIAEIIASVEDLAQQSNLLAVNAAIEAAKAGEQGKGFAVVAQEVKNLSEQSRQATTKVRNILNDIQKATATAAMATEQGSKAVDAGVNQATRADESILALSNSVTEAAGAAAQIAASSHQQLTGVDQVSAAMVEISRATTNNAASMKQVENAVRNLGHLGQRLKEMMAAFNTKEPQK
jgi:methyl-accepting chemotaxis protein